MSAAVRPGHARLFGGWLAIPWAGAGVPHPMLKAIQHRPGAGLILLAAFLSFVLSVGLWFTDNREEALFVGLWVPSILALGGFYVSLLGPPR